MCGRYLIEDEAYSDILEILYNPAISGILSGAPLPVIAQGEVFPTNIAPVYVKDGAEAVKWGFPHWSNDSVIINARSETALDKKMFGKALRERRCVIPSSGFYEWGYPDGNITQAKRLKKSKYLFNEPHEKKLYMAGMISTFTDPLGEKYDAFVILTTVANKYVSQVHNRMPVILSEDERDDWLHSTGFMEFVLQRPGPKLISRIA
ncbi:MAG: SOS response-associated peptidase [Oscillospiraceae bacterium]|jgi:putative SOS response-associated peptidase YedK|nr:SOS response-associated peptidase [Oscillospiraceae bacterium]